MVLGLASCVGIVVHPCRVIIYCNSLAPGQGARSWNLRPMLELSDGVLERLSSWLWYHFTYCNYLMFDLEILECHVFCLFTWEIMLAFYYQMLKLDKPHASTRYIVLWISPASTQCTYGAAIKLFCRFPSCEWLPRSSRQSRQCGCMVEVAPS
jgi:hypothetical protein